MTQPADTGTASERMVHADLINVEAYAIYKAITELFGEEGWQVIWRSGEIAFDELRERLDITETEPLPLMSQIAKWLVDVGYIKDIQVSQPSEEDLIYEMEGAVLRPSVMKLRAANAVLPHWSSVILIAALRKMCGIEVEMDVQPEILSPTRSRERWKLRPIQGK